MDVLTTDEKEKAVKRQGSGLQTKFASKSGI